MVDTHSGGGKERGLGDEPKEAKSTSLHPSPPPEFVCTISRGEYYAPLLTSKGE